MSLSKPRVGITTPSNPFSQKNFRVDGETQDFVLIELSGIIYLNSISRDYLLEVFHFIKSENLEIIDITGKSNQYGGLTGFLLKTDYKTIGTGARTIATRLRTNKSLIYTLNQKKE